MFTVYAHKNKLNSKLYIGITCQDPEKRWQNGAHYEGSVFERAIKKYGWDGFDHIILKQGLTRQEACDLEQKLIRCLRTQDRRWGYNVASGGDTGSLGCTWSWSAEAKARRSESNKGNQYRAKMVAQYDLEGNLIATYPSAKKAAEATGANADTIRCVARGVRKTAGGFIWHYE